MKISVGLVDDHQLFLKSLSILVDSLPSMRVVLNALNGEDLLHKLSLLQELPDILLIDVDMPQMNGVETAKRVTELYPVIKLVALSVKDDDLTILNMLRNGCCAYLVKDIHPDSLEKALHEIYTRGYYNADAANINYRRLIVQSAETPIKITGREQQFLELACSDRTYKQIASEMNLSERTIDGYRESLFEKLNVQSRVGMALEAVRRNIVPLNQHQ